MNKISTQALAESVVGIDSTEYENAMFQLRMATGLANTLGTLLMSGGDASEVSSVNLTGAFFSIELALKEACARLEQTKLATAIGA